jgi:hypothetical protein
LTLAEVARLQPASTASAAAMPGAVTPATPSAGPAAAAGTAVARRPIVQAGVIEKFGTAPPAGQPYRAHFGAHVRVHFVDAKAGVDAWEDWLCVAPLGPGGPEWSQAIMRAAAEAALGDTPAGGASFAEPPPAALAPRSYRTWEKQLEDHVYRTAARSVSYSAELKMFAESGSSEGEFRQRVAQSLRERRDSAIDALRTKYAAKLGRIEEQLRRSEQKIDRERAQAQNLTTSSVLTVGGSLLGALLGGGRRSSSALRRAGTAARDLGRVSKERADVANAEADANAVREQHDALQAELESEVTALTAQYEPDAIRIETVSVRARKADIAVENAALVWSA